MSKDNASIILGKDDNIAEIFPRRSRLAKKIIIKLRQHHGFELIVPMRTSMKQAINFLYRQEEWVLNKNLLLQKSTRTKFINGARIPILGELYTIKHTGVLRGITKLEGQEILVSGLEEQIGRKIKQFLLAMAKKEITAQAGIEARNLAVSFSKITVRDTSTRWGSCSRSGNISLSWRLIMAPRPILEYVIAHELAHLLQMNHSKKFWDIVASVFPHYKNARIWLRKHGGELHSYGD